MAYTLDNLISDITREFEAHQAFDCDCVGCTSMGFISSYLVRYEEKNGKAWNDLSETPAELPDVSGI